MSEEKAVHKRQPSPGSTNPKPEATSTSSPPQLERDSNCARQDTKTLYFAVASVALCATILTVAITPNRLHDFFATPALALPSSYALCSQEGLRSIYTVDSKNSRAQCLVVRGSRFEDVGFLEDIQDRWSKGEPLDVRYIDSGSIVVPGLSDSHGHILEYGASLQIPLEGTTSIEETVKRVREYILSEPTIRDNKTQFVEGWGWDHTKWLMETWPTADAFEADPDVAGRPVVLQSKDGHALWVSKTVLAAIKDMPTEVEGGVIMRDTDGNPTGVLLDNAQELVIRPEPTYETLEKRFKLAIRNAHAVGLTSIHDAGFDPKSLEFFRRQAEQDKLTIRIYGMTYFDETKHYWGNSVSKIIGAGNHRLTARSVKIFADGALRSGGAALYEPYTDNPATRGFMRIAPEVLNDVIPRFLRDGWQVNVHAIGDRANGLVLDAFETALRDANVSALRPRLEHAQILAQKDMARFGDLGVIASIQPTHAISDMWFGEARLGPERVKGLYAFRSILDHGARVTLGSDFPVENLNPLAGFYAAITRLSPEGTSPHGPSGWFPEQRMTREEALKGITIDPAYASFTEHILGSIVPGKRADYVVLSQDIMSIPARKVLKTNVIATVIDGQPVYGSF
ncbi:amidohydrolase family-domain-containing protein [Cristinia sonorae]|uniref:Amidohydrolase family-domain-containing protein n=1 Tax=Cristinia sonorae TaxID=1940300 RepID=A0A8K0UZX2_9AGAR|nr:amidohydrolase family-domain-containing protein [Cristinia sonorae]